MSDEEKQEAPVTEVPIEPAEPMKVSWGEHDASPVPTQGVVKMVRVYSNVDGRQLKVMKTADGEDCLHIYVDVV